MSQFTTRPLFSSTRMSLRDVRCRCGVSPPQAEERVSTPELIVTRRGVFVQHLPRAGRSRLVADQGRALLLNANEPYHVSHPTAHGDDCTVLTLDATTAVEIARAWDAGVDDTPATPFRVPDAPLSAANAWRVHKLRAAAARGELTELELEEEASDLLGRLVTEAYGIRGLTLRRASAPGRRRDAEVAEAVRLRIASAPSAAHSLTSLAHEVACSPFELARAFRRASGSSIHQHLMRVRVALALDRLSDGAGSLSGLALDLGFASHSHFTSVFRRIVGVTPADARRELRAS